MCDYPFSSEIWKQSHYSITYTVLKKKKKHYLQVMSKKIISSYGVMPMSEQFSFLIYSSKSITNTMIHLHLKCYILYSAVDLASGARIKWCPSQELHLEPPVVGSCGLTVHFHMLQCLKWSVVDPRLIKWNLLPVESVKTSMISGRLAMSGHLTRHAMLCNVFRELKEWRGWAEVAPGLHAWVCAGWWGYVAWAGLHNSADEAQTCLVVV